MTNLKLKLTLASLVFASAVAYLAFAGADKGWVYTLAVDHYMSNPQQQTQRVRLGGVVGEQDLVVQKAQLNAHFQLKGDTTQIAVAYHGIIPDLFKPGAEVLVEGKRDAAGVFQADVMMTKCASKYEAAPEGHPKDKINALSKAAGGMP